MNLTSDSTPVAAPVERIFSFLTDFRNFGKLLPEQVKEWSADESHCTFIVEGLPRISLKLGENIEGKRVTYLPDGESPVDFSLLFHMEGSAETGKTVCRTELLAKVSPMIAMMAKRPLQHFIELLSSRLKEHMESTQA